MPRFSAALALLVSACVTGSPAPTLTAPRPACADGRIPACSSACASGDAAACVRLADLLERACDHDDAAACEQRASRLAGDTLEGNRRAYALHVRACRLERWSSCVAAGTLARDGRGMEPSAERALALYTIACTHGDPRGCELQKEGKLDERVAFRHARAGCEAGAPHACRALALMYEEGRGVERDPGAAHRLHRKACDAGALESCKAIGEPEDAESLDAPGPPIQARPARP